MIFSCQGEGRIRLQLAFNLRSKNLEQGGSYMEKANEATIVIYRRYKTLPNGTVLDAYEYGHKAWPIIIKKNKK